MRAPETDQLIARLARAQFGLVGLDQLRAAGVPHHAVKSRLGSGRLERVLPRVYRVGGAPPSWDQDLKAAELWGGDGSAICGPPAAARWGVGGFRRWGVELAVTTDRHSRAVPFSVHRVDDHLLPEIVDLESVSVTSVRRTLLDLCGRKHPRAARALDDSLAKKLITLPTMWLFHDQEWLRGRRGIQILRVLLIERTSGKAPSESDLEDMFLEIVKEFAFPDPERQFPMILEGEPIRIDFAYPDARLLIECDSRTWHLLIADRFDADKWRDNRLQLEGWTVLRFTWAMLKYDRQRVADTVRQHLATKSLPLPAH